MKFFIRNGILYKRNHDSTLLRCVDKNEAERIMDELHENPTGRILLVYHGSRLLSAFSDLS